MSCTRKYGEPDWSQRPFEDARGLHHGHFNDSLSYEESRWQSMRLEKELVVKSSDVLSVRELPEDDTTDPCIWSASLSSQQIIYLKWSQSPVVEVIVGSARQVFRLPSEFLTCRSIPFRIMFEGPFEESSTHRIHLPETDPVPFQHIFLWLISSNPRLDAILPLPILVDVAIFATLYMMPALLHQSLDMLRFRMALSETAFTPDILERIYGQAEEQSLLRQLTRAAIPLSLCNPLLSKHSLDQWQSVFKEYPDLGCDYFSARWNGRSHSEITDGGPCRFHLHARQEDNVSREDSLDPCPRLSGECFEEIQMILIKKEDNMDSQLCAEEDRAPNHSAKKEE